MSDESLDKCLLQDIQAKKYSMLDRMTAWLTLPIIMTVGYISPNYSLGCDMERGDVIILILLSGRYLLNQ